MHSTIHGFHSKLSTVAVTLLLVTLWLLLRGYHGIVGDGQIYALQALAKIQPQLAVDLYLQNTSQDQFTIFSPFYAWFIERLGLEHAARLLTMIFTVWFLAAAWRVARTLTNRDGAWLAVAFLLITAGSYGGSRVFQYADLFLTARLPAEALVVTALACYVRGWRCTAFAISIATFLVHPLIALPGLLLLTSLAVPIRVGVAGALLGVGITLMIATAASHYSWVSHRLPVMDAAWLHIVQERSQFLFLQLWSFRDWDLNVRPFFYLGFTALVFEDRRIRKVCVTAALVGVAGVGVAVIASLVGPIALFVQGQAWRWLWIPALIAALLLPATALEVWRDEKCGPLCVILLVSGWTLSAVDGTACVSLGLLLWILRPHIGARIAEYSRWLAAALFIAIVVWILIQSRQIVASAHTPVANIQEIFGLKISSVLCATFVWWWLRTSRNVWTPTLLAGALAATSTFLLPAAFKESHTLAVAADTDEFSDWRSIIPPTSTVLVVPAQDVGAFVWFTLQRPNYLTLDQSAGVVFSRATAMEVQRRSDVLLPVMDPNWKILTNLRESAAARRKINPAVRPLSAMNLAHVCEDAALGFVISKQKVAIGSLRHEVAGAWRDWNLYDCRYVRAIRPNG
jgi:hypothetical protein